MFGSKSGCWDTEDIKYGVVLKFRCVSVAVRPPRDFIKFAVDRGKLPCLSYPNKKSMPEKVIKQMMSLTCMTFTCRG